MEKTDIRDDHTDSSDHFAFESAIVESNLLRKVEYADLPPPNDDVDESARVSHRRRPIRLKADLGAPKASVSDSRKSQAKAVRHRKKTGESARRHRPIQLKADVGVTKGDVPDTKRAQKKRSPERKKPSKPATGRRSIRLKADNGVAKADFPDTNKTQSNTVEGNKTRTPRTEKKTPVTAKTRKATPVRADTPMPATPPVEFPSFDALEPWFSWMKSRRRLLLIVGLSFTSGILVHSWLAPETPEPTKVMESSQPAQRSAMEDPALATQPVSSPRDVSDYSSQPTPTNSDYMQQNRGYRDPNYGNARQQQRPFSQYPDQERGDFNYPTRPQTPLSSTWRPSAGQPTIDNRYGTRQKYNPWTPRDPQYPSQR